MDYVLGKKEIAERMWEKMLHREIMSFGEPGLLVLFLHEEQAAGLTFGKEAHHLFSLSREATRTSPWGFIEAP